MSASTKAMKIQKARFKEIWESGWSVEKILEKKKKNDTRAHTQVQRRITGRNRPRHPPFVLPAQVKGMKEIERRQIDRGERKKKKKREEGIMCAASEHTQQDKNNTHKKKGVCGSVECDFVWVCSCVGVCSFFKFFYFVVVTPRGSPRSRADPLSLSCPPFIHSFPLYFFFLYTHSSSPPSLLAQR